MIYKSLGTLYHIEKVNQENQVTLKFTNILEVDELKQNLKLVEAAFKFEVIENKEYQ